MNTIDLIEMTANGNHAAADALHHRISEAGAIARIIGGTRDSFVAYELHSTVNEIVQSKNGTLRLVVIENSGNWENAVRVSTDGVSPKVFLVAMPEGEWYGKIQQNIPVLPPKYWADDFGDHWEVLLVSPDKEVFLWRESMSGVANFILRIIQQDGEWFGVPANPAYDLPEGRYCLDKQSSGWQVFHTDDDGVDTLGEVAMMWRSAQAASPDSTQLAEWYIDITPFDLAEIAANIQKYVEDAYTPRPAQEEILAPIVYDDDEPDDEALLSAAALAKLRRNFADSE